MEGPRNPETEKPRRNMTATKKATVVTCPHCGRRNRVPVAASGTPRCGNCHQRLPWVVDATDDDFAEVAEKADVPVSPAVPLVGLDLADIEEPPAPDAGPLYVGIHG